MLLPGRLSSTTLGDVLGTLHRGEVTGVLELTEVGPSPRSVPGRLHAVHLACGLVMRVETPLPLPTLAELVAARAPDADARAFVASLAHLPDADLVGVLLGRGAVVPTDVVRAALYEQLRSRLDAMFALQDARIAFRVARGRLDRAAPPLSAREFLHGRPRARDRSSAAGRTEVPTRASRERSRALTLLGLSDRASPDDVRRAFRRAARDLHPDRPGGAPTRERTERLAELSAAYHVLLT